MYTSSIIPALMAALLPLVAATECEFYKANNPGVHEPLGLALRCPPLCSLAPGEEQVFSEAVIDTNKCMADHFGALVPGTDGNTWYTCDGSPAVKFANGTLGNVICAPVTTPTQIDIKDFATAVSKSLVCGGYTVTPAIVTTGVTQIPT
ncbi:uncharacterized protein N7459_008869 [Penicillium hispanicum]|uniref:uncharacterized protein n=1 Tax=Penicillium hispanicum TaxID=1080232 RepID=UPI0025417AD9|nr:uncharacterized protein N7459_008869 [Penicillium hispanicum]KAJ5569439.1 hypothetical protein N7459_008869 [Penicillium hispanicum]